MKNVLVYGAGAAFFCLEPAPGPRTSGAAQKSGGSATLVFSDIKIQLSDGKSTQS